MTWTLAAKEQVAAVHCLSLKLRLVQERDLRRPSTAEVLELRFHSFTGTLVGLLAVWTFRLGCGGELVGKQRRNCFDSGADGGRREHLTGLLDAALALKQSVIDIMPNSSRLSSNRSRALLARGLVACTHSAVGLQSKYGSLVVRRFVRIFSQEQLGDDVVVAGSSGQSLPREPACRRLGALESLPGYTPIGLACRRSNLPRANRYVDD